MKTTAAATSTAAHAGLAHIARCREILNMTADPAAIAWNQMRRTDRAFLLLGAGLPKHWHDRQWTALSSVDRHRIMTAAPRVADWAARMARAFAGEVVQ